MTRIVVLEYLARGLKDCALVETSCGRVQGQNDRSRLVLGFRRLLAVCVWNRRWQGDDMSRCDVETLFQAHWIGLGVDVLHLITDRSTTLLLRLDHLTNNPLLLPPDGALRNVCEKVIKKKKKKKKGRLTREFSGQM